MTTGDRSDGRTEPHQLDGGAAVEPTADTLAYPISPDYVKSWTLTCTCQAKLLVKQLSIFQPCEARIRGVRLPTNCGRILDLGTGTGQFSAALARTTGATVVTCEPSAAMRAAAPAEAMPFRDGAFDDVGASRVVHHAASAATVRHVLPPPDTC